MITLLAGPGATVQPGEELDLPDDVARAMIRGGYATPIGGPETASVAAPERAVQPRPTAKVASPRPTGGEEALTELVGEGPAQALIEAGIGSIMQARLAIQAGEDLTEIKGVGPATVKKLAE